jgi:hypothetical protein
VQANTAHAPSENPNNNHAWQEQEQQFFISSVHLTIALDFKNDLDKINIIENHPSQFS